MDNFERLKFGRSYISSMLITITALLLGSSVPETHYSGAEWTRFISQHNQMQCRQIQPFNTVSGNLKTLETEYTMAVYRIVTYAHCDNPPMFKI